VGQAGGKTAQAGLAALPGAEKSRGKRDLVRRLTLDAHG
jgi:hypothetical protein